MKKYYRLLLFCLTTAAHSQNITVEEKVILLRKQLSLANGTNRIDVLNSLAEYASKSPHAQGWTNRADSQKYYSSLALIEAERLNYKKGIATSLAHLGGSQWLYAIPVIQSNKSADGILKTGEAHLLKAIPIAEEIKDYNLLGSIYEILSFQDRLYNDNKYKINNFKSSAHYFKLARNMKKEAEISTWLCEAFTSQGAFEEGFDYCRRNIELAQTVLSEADTKEDRDYLLWHVWNSLTDMAYVYELGGDYKTAKEYIFHANDFTAKNHPAIRPDYNSLAAFNLKMGNIDSARFYLKKSSVESWGAGNEVWYLISKAKILVDLKDYDSAIAILQKPYENYTNGKASWRVLLPLAKAYHQKGNISQALNLARESLAKVGVNQRVDLMNHYEVLAKVNESAKHFDSAYFYQNKYHQLKDSIINRQFLWQLNNYKRAALDQERSMQLALLLKSNLLKDKELQEQLLQSNQRLVLLDLLDKDGKIKDQQLQLKDQSLKEQNLLRQQKEYALSLLDKDNKLKDQQLKQQSFLRNALIAGLFLVLAMSLIVLRLLNLKRRNERLQNEKIQAELQQQSSELEMQALRAQMNPHFIFNCLSSINKFILKNESRAASDYLTRFSRLIRTVLTNSQLSRIPLSDELHMLQLYLDMERLRFNNNFDYNIVFENSLEAETIYIPPMILQPVCENAIWHGLMHKEDHGKLEIKLRSSHGHLYCEITDNGIGRSKAAEIKSSNGDRRQSFGLKITTERLAIFNSDYRNSDYLVEDLSDENGHAAGTRVTLKIKIRQTEDAVKVFA